MPSHGYFLQRENILDWISRDASLRSSPVEEQHPHVLTEVRLFIEPEFTEQLFIEQLFDDYLYNANRLIRFVASIFVDSWGAWVDSATFERQGRRAGAGNESGTYDAKLFWLTVVRVGTLNFCLHAFIHGALYLKRSHWLVRKLPHLTISWIVYENKIKKIALQKQPIFLLNGEVMLQTLLAYSRSVARFGEILPLCQSFKRFGQFSDVLGKNLNQIL